MILTKESLNKLLTDMWVRDVSEEQYSAILDKFGTEPCAKHELILYNKSWHSNLKDFVI